MERICTPLFTLLTLIPALFAGYLIFRYRRLYREIDRMLESYFFYFWNEDNNEIRLVTSFDTTEEDVDEFMRLLKR